MRNNLADKVLIGARQQSILGKPALYLLHWEISGFSVLFHSAALAPAACSQDAVGATNNVLFDVRQVEPFAVGTLVVLSAIKVDDICVSPC